MYPFQRGMLRVADAETEVPMRIGGVRASAFKSAPIERRTEINKAEIPGLRTTEFFIITGPITISHAESRRYLARYHNKNYRHRRVLTVA